MRKRILSLALTLAMLLAFVPAAALPAAASDSPYVWGFKDFSGVEVEFGYIADTGIYLYPEETAAVKDGKLTLSPKEEYAYLLINTGEECGGSDDFRGDKSLEAVPGRFYSVNMAVSSSSDIWLSFFPNFAEDEGENASMGVSGEEPTELIFSVVKDKGNIFIEFSSESDVFIHSLTVTEIGLTVPEIEGSASVNIFIDHTNWTSVWVEDDAFLFNADNVAERKLTKAEVEAAENFGGVASLDDSDRIGISIAVPSIAPGQVAEIEYIIHRAEVTYSGKPSLDLTKHLETESSGFVAPVQFSWGAGKFFVEVDIADAIRTAGGGTLDAVLAGFETIEVEVEITNPSAGKSPPNLDTADSWALDHINEAYAKGFLPEALQDKYSAVITRGEFVTLAMSWLRYQTGMTNDELVAEYALPENLDRAFSDTDDADVLAAAKLDVTAGVGGGVFGVDTQFNREQAAIMLMKICGILGEDISDPADFGFTDIGEAQWRPDAINFVGSSGVMDGTSTTEKLFSPKLTFTRQQSIIVFNKMG